MSDIVLLALNARWAHCSFGARWLLANLAELRPQARLLEFDTTAAASDIIEAVLAGNPRIVAIGVYIWNAVLAADVAFNLKRLRPDVVLVLGGPQVSYEFDRQEICHAADCIIAGEADTAFAAVCRAVLAGQSPPRVVQAPRPDLAALTPPYDLYDDADLARRVIYVESSRGCPFGCEFCLSSLDREVRYFPLDAFLSSLGRLLDRGARHMKFVDRTFNIDIPRACAILDFLLERLRPGLLVHFEMVPDRLPAPLRDRLTRFPPGMLQLELGVQTFDPRVAEIIGRRQDPARIEDNIRFLRNSTGVHVHADLVFGLPGETLDSFAAGFDRLLALNPQEIQVGILKRLPGAPIARHDGAWGMVYSAKPPFEVLQTSLIDFAAVQRVKRFARYWDIIANSGNFIRTLPLLFRGKSPFAAFMRLSDWLWSRLGRTHSIALDNLACSLAEYLVVHAGCAREDVSAAIAADFRRLGRSIPAALRAGPAVSPPPAAPPPNGAPGRQSRHLA